MLYDINGNILVNTEMELDYSYDASTSANYSVLRVYQTKTDGTKQYPFVRYPGRMTPQTLLSTENWAICINAGLGVSEEQPIDGIAIENSVVINNSAATYHAGAIPLTIDTNGNLGTASATATADSLSGIVSATCGFCPIVENYAPVVSFPTVSNVDHFNQNAQRQIIGQFGNGDYGIVSCAGRTYDNSDGWTLAEAQTICVNLGLKFAYCLDGGKSVATYINKHPVYDFQEGTTRIVPSFIVFNGKSTFSIP